MRAPVLSRCLYALIVVFVVIAVCAVIAYRKPITTALETHMFLRAYDAADQTAREPIAEKYLRILGSGAMLNALDNQTPVCHSEAHPIGRIIYRQTQSLPESLQMCGSSCSYGCFHGVLMEMFSTDSDSLGGAITAETSAGTLEQIINSAPTFCNRSDVSSVVLPWTCLHGLGHVVMYLSNYDIPKALATCETLPNAAETSICAGGAFMEYMRSDDHAHEVKQKNFFPCDQYPGFAKPCFVYKGQPMVEAFGSTTAALFACHTLSTREEVLSCIRAVGVGGTTLEMLEKEGGVDAVCGSLVGREKSACIDGAVTSVVFRMEADTPVCSKMAAPYSGYCAFESKQLHSLVLE